MRLAASREDMMAAGLAVALAREGMPFRKAHGVVGALVGGWIGTQLGWGKVDQGTLDFRSIGIATFGAIVLLLLGRLIRREKK